jgi:hypothetical protein
MPTNSETLNRQLYQLLSKYKPKPLDAEGKATPVPDEADIFKIQFTKDGDDYGTVFVTLDDERVMTVYFGDDVANSPSDKTPGLEYDDTWSGFLHQLSSWRMTRGLKGFNTKNKDHVNDDMARRNHMRNKDKIAEGYYPMGKKASYSDAIPTVKIVIEHSRVIEEGEKRYRNINKIFLENQEGERYLLDTKKPGIARVYARHIAEGGKVNDDRWNHVHSLCEEYQKMAGFVRATRNGQFNESAQSLVNEGIAHYASLRESLSRMTGKRGYNAYFESWTPALMEDEGDETNLNELFVQETLDPRIESVMPILNRIHKKIGESVVDKQLSKLEEWADSLTEEESIKSNNPVGIPESEGRQEIGQMMAGDGITYSAEKENEIISKMVEYMKKSGMDSKQIRYLLNYDEDYIADQLSYLPKEGMDESLNQYSPVTQAITRRILSQHPDLLQKHGPEKVGDAIDSVAEYVGDVEEIGSSDVSGWVKQVAQSLGGHEGMAENSFDPLKHIEKKNQNPAIKQAAKDVKRSSYADRAALMKAGGVKDDRGPAGVTSMEEDLDANQKRVGQLGPTEKVGKKGAVGKLVGANENFINTVDQAVVSEEDEMAEGILDSIKNMFKPKDPTPVTPVTSADIVNGYKTDPAFKAQIDQIAKQQGMTPQELIAHIKQGLDAGADVIGVGEGVMDAIKKGVGNIKQGVQTGKEEFKKAWDEEMPKLKQDWKNPIKTAFAKEGEMDEGAHTQQDRDLNPNDYKRKPTDWSVDPIEAGTDRIHDKISSMLKKLEKPKYKEPNLADTDIGSVLEAALPWEDDEEDKDDKKPKDTKGSDGSEHGGHSRAKHLAKNAIPKEKEEVNEMDKSQTPPGRDGDPRPGPERVATPITKEKMVKHALDTLTKSMDKKDDKKEVKEGQDDLDRILQIMNHRR